MPVQCLAVHLRFLWYRSGYKLYQFRSITVIKKVCSEDFSPLIYEDFSPHYKQLNLVILRKKSQQRAENSAENKAPRVGPVGNSPGFHADTCRGIQ